ncbi:hypothetical protein [Candidatus Absconditicoccus praedator]|uniref:hypothetical protein n=1 Tax=Candidatus Absconditicoccus praedator TaxID=2735562 RepID=UPI001E4EFFA2|nr:hypothetical protein [Candidatus Absconditicoccus praedator]UFX82661.1 hypothetical protein HLG78_00725 [Candidatus Absconditicoccus praedator]
MTGLETYHEQIENLPIDESEYEALNLVKESMEEDDTDVDLSMSIEQSDHVNIEEFVSQLRDVFNQLESNNAEQSQIDSVINIAREVGVEEQVLGDRSEDDFDSDEEGTEDREGNNDEDEVNDNIDQEDSDLENKSFFEKIDYIWNNDSADGVLGKISATFSVVVDKFSSSKNVESTESNEEEISEEFNHWLSILDTFTEKELTFEKVKDNLNAWLEVNSDNNDVEPIKEHDFGEETIQVLSIYQSSLKEEEKINSDSEKNGLVGPEILYNLFEDELENHDLEQLKSIQYLNDSLSENGVIKIQNFLKEIGQTINKQEEGVLGKSTYESLKESFDDAPEEQKEELTDKLVESLNYEVLESLANIDHNKAGIDQLFSRMVDRAKQTIKDQQES